MKLILDTNIFIDKLRGGTKLDEFLFGIDEDAELFLPTVVVFELFSGLSSKEKLVSEKINGFRKYLREVDLNWNIAKKAAEIHRDNRDIEAFDCIIASTAIELGAQVVTLNKKHFSQIPQVVIYHSR